MPPVAAPDPHLLGDFVVSGDITLGNLAEIYGVSIGADKAQLTLADYDITLDHAPRVRRHHADRRDRSRGARDQRRPRQCRRPAPAGGRGRARAAADAIRARQTQAEANLVDDGGRLVASIMPARIRDQDAVGKNPKPARALLCGM